MSEGKSKSFLVGAVLGALAGAATALLYAPQRGEKTREQFKSQALKAKKKVDEIQSEMEKKGGILEVTEKTVKSLVENLAQSAQTFSEKEGGAQSTEKPKDSLSAKKKPRFFKGV